MGVNMNEPVAYIPFAWYCAWLGNSAEPVWEQYEKCHPSTKEWDNFPDKIIPLYTHLAKTLTPLTEDECRAIIEKHNWFAKSWAEMAMEIQDAILRKAQEK